MNRRQFVTGLAATAGCMALGVRGLASAHAAGNTHQETWDNLDDWQVIDTGDCQVSSGTLKCENSVVLKHKTLAYDPAYPMEMSGWIKSPDIKTSTRSYFGIVLQSDANGQYYGSTALGNWRGAGSYEGPEWILFTNEYQMSTRWWSALPNLVKPYDARHNYRMTWQPLAGDGSKGRWKFKLDGKYYESPDGYDLPMPVGPVRPALGFGGGRAIVGPIAMTGTPS